MLLADGLIDLRLGRWQDVLADVTTCDAVICDPPYSARTHEGQYTTPKRLIHKGGMRTHFRKPIEYEALTHDDAVAVVASWAQRSRGWCVVFCSHDLTETYTEGFRSADRYVFAPLPFLNEGGPVRLAGDGPSSWTCWIIVARPRSAPFSKWGTLPGGYYQRNKGPHDPANVVVMGGKPLGLMRAIVRDYTRPGDLVVDPFCGGGTTALACAIEGRRCITSEMDPVTFEKAKKRLERGFTPSMFRQGPRVKAKQGSLV